jgi:hypothetical protein
MAPYSSADSMARSAASGWKEMRSARSPAARLRWIWPMVSAMAIALPTALRLVCSASAISAAVCSGGSQINNHPNTRPVTGGNAYWRA